MGPRPRPATLKHSRVWPGLGPFAKSDPPKPRAFGSAPQTRIVPQTRIEALGRSSSQRDLLTVAGLLFASCRGHVCVPIANRPAMGMFHCLQSLPVVFVWGAFSHSAGTAPIIPGTPLKTTHPQMHDPFKTASGVQNSGPWDPWQASDYNKKSLVYQQGL